MDGRSEDATKAILEEMSPADHRIRVLDNPRSGPRPRPQHRARERARRLRRADGRAHRYPPEYVAKGIERLRARRRGGVGHRAPIPHGIGPGHGASRSRSPPGSAPAARPSGRGREEERTSTPACSRACGSAPRSTTTAAGTTAGRSTRTPSWPRAFFERGSRIVCMPELGALYVPRDSLKKLARQYWRYGFYRAKTSRYHPSSMRRSAIFPPALVLAVVAAVIAPRPIRLAAQAALGAWAAAVLGTSARVGARAFRARRRRPAGRVRRDAPLLGARLPARVPGLRAAAGGAGTDRRPAPRSDG